MSRAQVSDRPVRSESFLGEGLAMLMPRRDLPSLAKQSNSTGALLRGPHLTQTLIDMATSVHCVETIVFVVNILCIVLIPLHPDVL